MAGGALAPLADPDLPMHLALGEWIVRHHAVPFHEPFAWTRAGAPFYAYSWAMDLLYYWVGVIAGSWGLRVLWGVFIVACAAVMLPLGRVVGWRPWTTLVVALLTVVVAFKIVPMLRPQSTLLIAVPVAWAAAYAILRAPRVRWAVAALVAASALAANSHLLFFLTAAPWVLLFTETGWRPRRVLALVLGTMIGWLLSPYVLVWPQVLHLNLGYNALLVLPSPIQEFKAGWVASANLAQLKLFAVAALLALLPWLAPSRLSVRQCVGFGALWFVGLVGFGVVLRALLVWWLLALPLVGYVVGRLPEPSTPLIRKIDMALVCVFAAAPALLEARPFLTSASDAGWPNTRQVALIPGSDQDLLASWLDCHTRPTAHGRVFTWFNFGSYLTWRLPDYSESVDGRTIFPDSVAKPETYSYLDLQRPAYGPWASADVAMLRLRHGAAPILDTASGWTRVAVTNTKLDQADSTAQRADASDSESRPSIAAALWVRDEWWKGAGDGPLPARAAVLTRAEACAREDALGRH